MMPWGPLLEKAPFLGFPKCSCITSVAPQIPSWIVYDIHGQMLSSNSGNLPPAREVTFPHKATLPLLPSTLPSGPPVPQIVLRKATSLQLCKQSIPASGLTHPFHLSHGAKG